MHRNAVGGGREPVWHPNTSTGILSADFTISPTSVLTIMELELDWVDQVSRNAGLHGGRILSSLVIS